KRNTIGIITEGMYDVLRTYYYLKELNLLDKYSVVGTFGAEVSVPQFRKIKEYFDRIILYGDNDSAGVGMERDIYKAVRRSIPIILKFNYKGHDAGKVKLA